MDSTASHRITCYRITVRRISSYGITSLWNNLRWDDLLTAQAQMLLYWPQSASGSDPLLCVSFYLETTHLPQHK